MARKRRKILSVLRSIFTVCFLVFAAYFFVLVVSVLWAFEVKLKRRPTLVYSAPILLKVGDNVVQARVKERLLRLGYTQSTDPNPPIGRFSELGGELRVALNACPFEGLGIVTGPVNVRLDWNIVRSIELERSNEEVNQVLLEPELISVIPAKGESKELYRPVSLEEMNPVLVSAVILAEDSRFFSHHGIDLASIRLAVVSNWRAGRYVQGGSTIVQQLMKMTLLTPSKSLWRKFHEIWLALVADLIYSKETILQAYLNRVYLGQWGRLPVKGVAEASFLFFGRHPRDMSPAQCALLAATIVGPNVVNPFRNRARALRRRNMILGLLLKRGKIDAQTHQRAIDSPLHMNRPGAIVPGSGPFMDMVKARLADEPDPAPEGRTRDVLTSLDPLVQTDAHRVGTRLSRGGNPSHLIVADPVNGLIRALVVSGRDWSGEGRALSPLTPIMVVPALARHEKEGVRFTLTSQVFLRAPPEGMTTFRKAFEKETTALTEKITGVLGTNAVLETLQQFGVPATADGSRGIALGPISPLRMAGIYSLMATLGRAADLGPGIKEVRSHGQDDRVEIRTVSVDPAVIFLVNHMLRTGDSPQARSRKEARQWRRVSFFSAKDREGFWSVAYTRDGVVVLRARGPDRDMYEVKRTLVELLRQSQPSVSTPFTPPRGIVHRKICRDSGLRATSLCLRVFNEPYLRGTQPAEWCPLPHHSEASPR